MLLLNFSVLTHRRHMANCNPRQIIELYTPFYKFKGYLSRIFTQQKSFVHGRVQSSSRQEKLYKALAFYFLFDQVET
jgi:hypothetical protein